MISLRRSPDGKAKTKESLAERAYDAIRDKILRGYYPVGTALSRRELAKELRMSFLPVSEALQHLEIDGLLESKPRVGTRVRIPTQQEILERYEVREALETQAARLCITNGGESGKQDLVKMALRLDQLYASGVDADAEFLHSLHVYHVRFHLRIAELGGNSLLVRAIQSEQVLVFNWLFDTAARRTTLPPLFHSHLAKKLSGSDVEAADQAMRAHVRYGVDDILAAMHSAKRDNGWRVRRKADRAAGGL